MRSRIIVLSFLASLSWSQSIAGITNVVIIVSENRSFDHMFGTFPGAEGTLIGHMKNGVAVALAHSTDLPLANYGHTGTDAHADIDGGKMDGFAPFSSTVNDVNQAYVQLWQSDIPQLWALAQSGGVADHHFTPIAGPTFTKQT
jgi:phospholipase C